MTEALVSLRNVSKDYRGYPALNDVSFDIPAGRIVGYIGPNGAGKTTTIKSLMGLITDFRGEVSIDGLEMPGRKKEVHRLIGYLPQGVAFQEWRTVDHVLMTFGRLSGIEPAELDGRIEEALSMVGLSGSRHRRVNQLSGGNIQKVGLAQALIHRPKLLVLDEPLTGLDPANRYNLKKVIRRLRDEGMTIFFSSHILSDVQDLADSLCMISNGRIVFQGGAEELRRNFCPGTDVEVTLTYGPDGTEGIRSIPHVDSVIRPTWGRMVVTMDTTFEEASGLNTLLKGLMELGYGITGAVPLRPDLDEIFVRHFGGRAE